MNYRPLERLRLEGVDGLKRRFVGRDEGVDPVAPPRVAGGALFDRFLLRCHVDNLKREAMPRLLAAGWELERAGPAESSCTADDLRDLSSRTHRVDLSGISEPYAELVFKVRDLGIALSD